MNFYILYIRNEYTCKMLCYSQIQLVTYIIIVFTKTHLKKYINTNFYIINNTINLIDEKNKYSSNEWTI